MIRRDRGIAVSDLAVVTGIADKTLRRRRIQTGYLNFAEFDLLCAALEVSSEDVLNLNLPVESMLRRAA